MRVVASLFYFQKTMLRKERGYIGLSGPRIDLFAAKDTHVDANHYHLTLFSKAEIREHHLCINQLPVIDEEEEDLLDVGVGRSNGETFKVMLWPRGDHLRRKYALPPKDFHITLRKGVWSNIYNRNTRRGVQSLLSHPPSDAVFAACTDATFDRLYTGYMKCSMAYEALLSVKKYMAAHPFRPAGFVRYGDTLCDQEKWKVAMLFYAHAASIQSPETIKEAVLNYCIDRICHCAQYTELGPVFTDEELADLGGMMETPSIDNWPATLRQKIRGVRNIAQRARVRSSRERLIVIRPEGQYYYLPRFLQWLVPFAVAFMSTPRIEADVTVLEEALNIGLMVTLMAEGSLPESWFNKGTRNLFVPIENYRAPTVAQVEHIFSHAETTFQNDRAVLIHCGGGKGRAGTVAACWLVCFGFSTIRQATPVYSAIEAISIVRELRPGSIETVEQERFVAEYVRHLWKPHPEPEKKDEQKHDLVFDGHFTLVNTGIIILCGLPGSGKSWFAHQFMQQQPQNRKVVMASGDDLGNLSRCQDVVSKGIAAGHLVVVDRCNLLPTDRASFNPFRRDTICIWMATSADVCIERAELRTNHPTLPAHRVKRTVQSFSKTFVAPDREAEGFKCVAQVYTANGAEQLLSKIK